MCKTFGELASPPPPPPRVRILLIRMLNPSHTGRDVGEASTLLTCNDLRSKAVSKLTCTTLRLGTWVMSPE